MRSFRHTQASAWFLVLPCALLSGALGACRPPSVPLQRLSLSEQLMDPDRREAAFDALLSQARSESRLETEEPGGARIHHVLRAPQAEGPPMYVVFKACDPETFPGSGPGLASGPFTLVDGEGRFVPIFSTANVIGPDSRIFPYAGDGRLAVAHRIGYGSEGGVWRVQILHIVPITPAQRSLLSVVVGPPTLGSRSGYKEFSWTWRLREQRSGAPPVVELGPRLSDGSLAHVAAAFQFNPHKGRYVGPDGSLGEGFQRIVLDPKECCSAYSQATAWAMNFVRAASSYESPLPVIIEHQPPGEAPGPRGVEVEWPGPGDSQPILRIRLQESCPPTSVELEYGSWLQRVEAPGLRTEIPTHVLKQWSPGENVTLRWRDCCGNQSFTSFGTP